jgi:hypothetical protein
MYCWLALISKPFTTTKGKGVTDRSREPRRRRGRDDGVAETTAWPRRRRGRDDGVAEMVGVVVVVMVLYLAIYLLRSNLPGVAAAVCAVVGEVRTLDPVGNGDVTAVAVSVC